MKIGHAVSDSRNIGMLIFSVDMGIAFTVASTSEKCARLAEQFEHFWESAF